MEGLKAFKDEAAEFCARKVGAVSGDARRALDICRRAVEIAQDNSSEIVSLYEIDAAIKEMFASSSIIAIQSLSLFEKIFISVLVAQTRRFGLSELEFSKVSQAFSVYCKLNQVYSPSCSEIVLICSALNQRKCITLQDNRAALGYKIRLNLSEDDVKYALRDEKIVKKLLT